MMMLQVVSRTLPVSADFDLLLSDVTTGCRMYVILQTPTTIPYSHGRYHLKETTS